MECNQHNCDEPAAFRFTWPGRDDQAICMEHAPKLRALATAMGFHLQLRLIGADEWRAMLAAVAGADLE